MAEHYLHFPYISNTLYMTPYIKTLQRIFSADSLRYSENSVLRDLIYSASLKFPLTLGNITCLLASQSSPLHTAIPAIQEIILFNDQQNAQNTFCSLVRPVCSPVFVIGTIHIDTRHMQTHNSTHIK